MESKTGGAWLYGDSIRHSSAARVVQSEAARFNGRERTRKREEKATQRNETELDDGPVASTFGPAQLEMRLDTFNKHRLDIKGLSPV